MNSFTEKLRSSNLLRGAMKFREIKSQMKQWQKRGYLDHAPQHVKQNVFAKYGIPGAPWIETGTYYGTTTEYLIKNYPAVYSIEPSESLYKLAEKKFADKNVVLFNDVSEKVLPDLLPRLSGDINFWLDGHYSAGATFQGSNDCPIEDELDAIAKNISNFSKVVILIDDVRCFLPSSNAYSNHVSIDTIVDWARTNQMDWTVEQDIFVIGKL